MTRAEGLDSPAPGTQWRNRKTGKVAEVVRVEHDNVFLKRGDRSSIKYLPHFRSHYVPLLRCSPLELIERAARGNQGLFLSCDEIRQLHAELKKTAVVTSQEVER